MPNDRGGSVARRSRLPAPRPSVVALSGRPSRAEAEAAVRTLIRWAYLTTQYAGDKNPILRTLQRALTNRVEPETAAAIEGIAQRIFGVANPLAGEDAQNPAGTATAGGSAYAH